MKAVAFSPEDEKLDIISREIPDISDNEVLVKVKEVGLDGTDKEIIEGSIGQLPKDKDNLVIGHESLGEVEKVGDKVDNFEPGDLVVATVRRPDDCINCQNGELDMCLKGNYTERGIKGEDGYLKEFYKEKPEFLIKIPKELEDIGVLLEPMSVAEKAVRMGYEVQKRMIWKPEIGLVTGSGTLGLLISFLLKLKGLEVSIMDLEDNDYKNKIFSRLSINHFNAKNIELHDIPNELGKQIDIILEATGDSGVALHSMLVVGTNGVVVLLSVTGGSKEITLCSDCLNEGMVLQNKAVVGSVNSNRIDFEQGILDLKKINRKWPGLIDKLITVRYKIEEIDRAIESLNENIKSVVDFQND